MDYVIQRVAFGKDDEGHTMFAEWYEHVGSVTKEYKSVHKKYSAEFWRDLESRGEYFTGD